MRIAIVGAGIAGLGAAWLLTRQGHAVTLFEANDRLGGHTATVDVTLEGRTFPVDTGFLVFNDRTYPAAHRAVRRTRRHERRQRDVVLLPRRSPSARMGGHQLRVAVRAAAQCAASGVLADAGRHRALQSRRLGHGRRRPRVVDLARRIPRRRRLFAAVPRLVPAADGRGDLVGAAAGHPRLSAADVRALLPQPRSAADHRPAALAHRRRRRPRLRGEDRSAIDRRAHRARRSARSCARRPVCRSTPHCMHAKRSTRSSSHATATRRSHCWPTRRAASSVCCRPCATSRIASCCTPTPRCCRARAAHGRRGITWPSTTLRARGRSPCPT